jgi:hypothetical protein
LQRLCVKPQLVQFSACGGCAIVERCIAHLQGAT